MKEKLKLLYANKWFRFGAITVVAFLSAAAPGLGLFLWFVWFAGFVLIFE